MECKVNFWKREVYLRETQIISYKEKLQTSYKWVHFVSGNHYFTRKTSLNTLLVNSKLKSVEVYQSVKRLRVKKIAENNEKFSQQQWEL